MFVRMQLPRQIVLVFAFSGLLYQAALADEPKFTAILISGEDPESLTRAEKALEFAESIEDCQEVRWVRSKKVRRLIGVFDEGLAGRVDGEETILHVEKQFLVQQSIGLFQRKDSKLEIGDLIRLSNLLPWNPDELPKGVEFYRDFEDPLEFSSFSSTIIDLREYLRFYKLVEDEVGSIRYVASTKFKVQGRKQVVPFLIIGLDQNKDHSSLKLKLPFSPQPIRHLIIGADLVVLYNSNSQDDATEYLNRWIDQLENRVEKEIIKVKESK